MGEGWGFKLKKCSVGRVGGYRCLLEPYNNFCPAVTLTIHFIISIYFSFIRCEKMLMSSVSVSNCIKFYQTAEDIGAKDLQKYCAEIISNHWVGCQITNFSCISPCITFHYIHCRLDILIDLMGKNENL